MTSVDSQNIPCFPGATPRCPVQRSIQRKCFMAAITTGVVLLRWQLLSAVLMFLASTLNIRFRKSDYIGLAV
ncbi:YjcB family protein, partial [Klebsiella pneumoniae]|uniref:YjcB family protein n=1 Tax=Klebsiella pneumoniae TaxID=573 RepID=UPI003A4C6798